MTEALLVGHVPAGTLLAGRYRVRAKLGEGAVAAVYLADDEHLGAQVALKILDPLRAPDPIGKARFVRELAVLERIRHPGVARALGFVEDGDLEILVLEHLEGDTLAARLSRGPMSVREVTELGGRLARALEACHREGVLHRDLKPANVILHPERGPVILDFGVAWFSSAATLTRTGSVIGSPEYMAPELFRSPHADARADVYSVGAILYEALTGRPVRPADSVAELAGARLLEVPPLASTLVRDVPGRLAGLVARAVAPRPEDRFATAEELAEALARGDASPASNARARLQQHIACKACGTSLIIDLPFCPGCGVEQVWRLTPGAYAVQLTEVPDPERAFAWLMRRHRTELRARPAIANGRLRYTPVPLAVGISKASAEQLLAEADAAGCRGERVGARAIIGARVRASQASIADIIAAAGLHFAAVLVAAVVIALLGARVETVYLLPAVMALVGVLAATAYARRPVLEVKAAPRGRRQKDPTAPLRAGLGELASERARGLAAGAIARAAPVLLGDTRALSEDAEREVLEQLALAVAAARELDVHAAVLGTKTRSRLAAELGDAAARREQRVPGAEVELARLEAEKRALTEAAIAHDLAARRALEACQVISGILAGRSEALDEARRAAGA